MTAGRIRGSRFISAVTDRRYSALGNMADDSGRGSDLVRVREFSQGKTNGRTSPVQRQAHRKKNVRGDDAADHAGRAAGGADSFEIERHQHRFGIEIRQADVERIRESLRRIAIQYRTRNPLGDFVPELIAQFAFAGLLPFQAGHDKSRRRRHSSDRGHIFSTWSPLVLVCPAELDRLDWNSATQKKKSRAFRPVEFVSGETGGID